MAVQKADHDTARMPIGAAMKALNPAADEACHQDGGGRRSRPMEGRIARDHQHADASARLPSTGIAFIRIVEFCGER